jgi:hypothetical protein
LLLRIKSQCSCLLGVGGGGGGITLGSVHAR